MYTRSPLIAQCILGFSVEILMRHKRLGWIISVKSSQDLRLKGLFGIVFSLFIIRDIYFVRKSVKQKSENKKP